MKTLYFALLALVIAAPAKAGIAVTAWGGIGKEGVDLYTLTNKNGMEVKITNYGATITAIKVPDRTGQMTNVAQGYESLAEYTSPNYGGRYGAVIGRFANRIKGNRFSIDGAVYPVGRNVDGHESDKPFDERVWKPNPFDGDEPRLILDLIDRNGTMGYPGTLRVRVTYTLTASNVLRIGYHAVTDKPTVVSLTNHSYFNLAGDTSGSVLDQLLTVNGDYITAGDETNTPTGEMRAVAGTAFDFRNPTPIGKNIAAPDPAIQKARGFDQNYAINGKPGVLRFAARLEDPKSGRVLEEWTTQPGVQVYSANYSPPPVGIVKGYATHSAVALEAQGFPNAPNIPAFPSVRLNPNQSYDQVTEYRFSVR